MVLGLRNALRLTASAAVLAAAASAAQASSFAIRAGQSAEGLGMAYAGAASGGIGLGAMAWNPAAITMFPGRQSQWNATYLLPQARYRIDGTPTVAVPGVGVLPINSPLLGPAGGTLAGSAGLGLNGAFIPASYNAWQITDSLFVGLTNTAPFGLRSKPGGFWAGQTYGRSATVRTVNIAPTVGYRINDWISVGAALQIQYLQVDLKQALGLSANANTLQLRGDDWQLGYRVGVTLTPFRGTNIGIAYRSGFDHDLKGQGRLFLNSGAGSPGAIITPVRVNIPLPGSVVVGLSQQINEQWQAHFGLEWTNWGRFGTLPVFNRSTGAQYALPGAPPTPVNLRFNYKDSWFFSAGAEYRFNQALTLRAGIGYELSAIDDSNRSPLISDNDRLWLSAGFSYQVTSKLNLDVGYTFINVNKARFRYAPGDVRWTGVSIAGTADPKIHIVSAGLTYRWDDPAVAIPVTKGSAPIAVRY